MSQPRTRTALKAMAILAAIAVIGVLLWMGVSMLRPTRLPDPAAPAPGSPITSGWTDDRPALDEEASSVPTPETPA